MSTTTKHLGFIPKNRDEYISGINYYKDNIVQYKGYSFIADPVGYDAQTNPNAYVTTVPFTTNPKSPNAGWRPFALGAYDEVVELGEQAKQFINDANAIVDNYAPIQVTGDVTNAADEEDLTSVNVQGTDVIKLKDKAYAPTIFSGLGRKYLRKNIQEVTVEGETETKNILTQEMMNDANTIYHIQYDYDLNGAEITVPEGCVLEFDGGSLRNGTIIGIHTRIVASNSNIFKKGTYRYKGYKTTESANKPDYASKVIGDNLYIQGTWDNDAVCPAWIGLDSIPVQEDAAPLIIDFISLHKEGIPITLPKRTYGIYRPIEVAGKIFDGGGSTFLCCKLSDVYDSSVPIPVGLIDLDSTKYPHGISVPYQYIYVKDGGTICNFTVDQSNITLSDVVPESFGIYGLIGVRGIKKCFVKNVIVKNAFQNGCLGVTTETEFDSCTFDGSGEHEVYCRPQQGNITFKNCTFTNWENIEEYATLRGAAFAIKLLPVNNRSTPVNVYIENCSFIKGSSYSNYCVQMNGDAVYFSKCNTDSYGGIFGDSSTVEEQNREKHLYIDSCDGIFFDTQHVGLIPHISNSKGSTNILASAFEVSNCILKSTQGSSNVDARNYNLNIDNDAVRKLSIQNCTIILRNDDNVVYIIGAYNIDIDNCRFVTDGVLESNGARFAIKTNVNNTEIEDINPTINIRNSSFWLGKRVFAFLEALNYSINSISNTICGDKHYNSGYLDRLYFIKSCKSLNIIDSHIIPALSGVTLNYCKEGFDVHTLPIISTANPKSNIGMASYNYDKNIPIWWNGAKWINGEGYTVAISYGTTAQRPTSTLKSTDVGYVYFDTTLGKSIYFNGTKWVDTKGMTAGVHKGNTEYRGGLNLNPATDIGYEYFDTTLGKPIYFNGTGWVDATGTAV